MTTNLIGFANGGRIWSGDAASFPADVVNPVPGDVWFSNDASPAPFQYKVYGGLIGGWFSPAGIANALPLSQVAVGSGGGLASSASLKFSVTTFVFEVADLNGVDVFVCTGTTTAGRDAKIQDEAGVAILDVTAAAATRVLRAVDSAAVAILTIATIAAARTLVIADSAAAAMLTVATLAATRTMTWVDQAGTQVAQLIQLTATAAWVFGAGAGAARAVMDMFNLRLDFISTANLRVASINFATGALSQANTDNSGAPGATTINKPTGRAAIALGAAAVTVTNSTVAAADTVLISPMLSDATALVPHVSAVDAGSFVVTASANATAALPFMFTVVKAL